jgi:2-polyprenyl-6-methoxyphenol hydroxylase-like FAD-dependent oxidoreductase
MRIAVVGGGPAGLYFGILMRRLLPQATIHIFEQNGAQSTFGFGVGLQSGSWSFFKADNPAVFEDIIKASHMIRGHSIVHKGETITLDYTQDDAGIGRLALLHVLQDHAARAGTELKFCDRIADARRFDDYDLVVGADGVNSIVRNSFEQEFGTTRRELTARMAWYGTNKPFNSGRISFRKTPFGWFWCVAYAHSPTTSTFLAECDDAAYRASGVADMSQEEQVAFAEHIFAEDLDGARILYNNSVWRALPVIRVKHWNVGKYVLVGDALHSPHPSIGSGTRLAMDDSSALAKAIAQQPGDIPAALAAYRLAREPAKSKLLIAMEASMEWYETITGKLDDMTAEELTFCYLARTGRVSRDRLRDMAPGFMAEHGESDAAKRWLG